jgi:hypothetical protein
MSFRSCTDRAGPWVAGLVLGMPFMEGKQGVQPGNSVDLIDLRVIEGKGIEGVVSLHRWLYRQPESVKSSGDQPVVVEFGCRSYSVGKHTVREVHRSQGR